MAMTRRSSSTVSLTRREPAGSPSALSVWVRIRSTRSPGKIEAGVAGGLVDRDGDRAHAGLEHRGEEAPLAGLDHAAGGERLPDGERLADDRAHELCLVGLAADQIALGHGHVGPVLPAQRVRAGRRSRPSRSAAATSTALRCTGSGVAAAIGREIAPLEPGAHGEGGGAGEQERDDGEEQATHGVAFRLQR